MGEDHSLSEEGAESGENYGHAPVGVDVSFPETVTIRMVDASALGDYEFSLFVAGFFCNVAVGFLVSTITIEEDRFLLSIVTAVFAFAMIVFIGWAFSKRAKLKSKERTVRMSRTGAKLIVKGSNGG